MSISFTVKNIARDVADFLLYDLRGKGPAFNWANLASIPKKYAVHVTPDQNGYILNVKELPGFIIHTPSLKEAADRVTDAMYVYFDVPRYYAKRLSAKGVTVYDNQGNIVSIGKHKLGQKLIQKEETLVFANN